MSAQKTDEIVELEVGYKKVREDGIIPFLERVTEPDKRLFVAGDYVKLYDLVFKMCIQRDPYNYSAAMYDRYTEEIRNYLLTTVADGMNKAKTQHALTFLREWENRWKNHKRVVKGMSKLFTYLDRFYTPNTDGVYSLNEQGYRLYKEIIFDKFRAQAAQNILTLIQRERDNEAQDRQLLSLCVNVYVEMGYNLPDTQLRVYKQDLETRLIEHAGQHYKRVARSWLDQDSCPNYLQKAEAHLHDEDSRVEDYLNQSTLEPLRREVYIRLLKEHQNELLQKGTGVRHMLANNRRDDLARLYRLYSPYPADLEPIGTIFHDHVSQAGIAIVDQAQKSTGADQGNHSLVRNLIDLHERYNSIVRDCLGNNSVFQKSLKAAFEQFINKDNRVSKLLAKFVNDVLKKGTKVNAGDVESTLRNTVFLYGYITEKDVFERDYQIFLANRLLMGLCESEHSEKSMIAKLKTESGYQWTNRLEGMFKDVQLSKDLMGKFKRHYDTEKNLGLTLDVNVCTTGYWPSSKMVTFKMPTDLKQACEKYKQFYLSTHSGHKIEWRMDQGKAEVQVYFSKTLRRTLACTTYQMLILLVFNGKNRVTFQDILDATGIPRYEIANHLLSLAHPKVQVLLKKPNNRELEPGHMFMINGKYNSKLLKVQIPMLATQPNKRKKDEEEKAIELQRRHQMDAAIVRIMKIRKELKHNRLVGEVISQLSARFKPKPLGIKKRIEALIELEYLKRDDNDRSVYQYLA